jgi:murein DD-endopeptidase MepM/ murein hydrolase activator NlpD
LIARAAAVVRLRRAPALSFLTLAFPLLTTAAGDATTAPLPATRYSGYSWPVAPGCTQHPRTYPNFGNKVRERKDGSMRAHLGVDVIPPEDDPHVYVAKKGTVVTSSPARKSGWGNYVVIRHADGLRTLYAHLVEPSRLKLGEAVEKGDVIGVAGKTETFYVHAHFEVHGKASNDWTRGRLDPVSVVGPLNGCRNSAAR